jgi:DNA-binding protein HU-beta
MNKAQLIEEVAKATELPKKEVTVTVNAVIDTIKKALKKGEKVMLVGFGTWEVRKRKARKGVNPRTGEPIKIKASKAVAFKPGASLKAAVAGKKK